MPPKETEQIDSDKFSKTIRGYSDDKLRYFIQEIYLDGMREGYELAKFQLKALDGMLFPAGNKYLDEKMTKIRKMIKPCEAYEESKK